MASLAGQSIASSYEQLLHVDRDGGGNSTTLVNIKDGDNGTTFALQMATDKIYVDGSVGVGHDLSSHTQKLVVKNNASATTLTAGAMLNLVNEQGAGNTASIRFSGSQQNAFLGFFDGSSTATQRIAIGVGSGGTGDGHLNVTADGTVGVGTATPSSFDSEANNLVVGDGSGDNGITIFTGSSAGDYGSIFFGDATGTPKQGQIRYEQNNEVMSFYTNTTERMIIDLNGNVGIGVTPSDYFADYDNLVLGATSGSTGMTIVSGGSNNGTVAFADGTSGNAQYRGEFGFSHNNEFLFLNTAGSYRMVISAEASYMGMVGIGLTDPNSMLMVGSATGGDVSVASTDTTLVADDTLGSFMFKGKDDGGDHSYGIGAKIVAKCTEAWNEGTSEGTKLEFHSTADGANSNTLNMVLDGNSRISLSNNDSGTSNTIFGKNTAVSLDAGSNYNTFIGENVADASLDDASYNIGIGYNALTDLTTADSTVAIGALCLENITTGAENTAVGTSAMRNSTTGNNNTALGRQAMGSGITTGTDNTAVGINSGLAITSSQFNTLIGSNSGSSITTGWNSVMIGYATGDATVDSHKHTLVGAGACGNGDLTTDGAVAVGYTALADLTVGTCVGVGFEAGKDNSSGGNNVFLGYKAGHSGSGDVTDGQANVIIGSEATANASGAINRIAIGRTATAVADNSVTLGNASVTAVYMAQDGDAVMYADASINSSDRRLKENISDSDLGLAFVNALRPVSYNLKNKKNSAKLKYGIIAQEVQEVLKESGNEDFAGITDKGEYLGADYVQFIAPLIKAVQELSAKVEELENK